MTGISRRAWLRGSAGIAGLGLLAGQGRRLFAAAGMPPRSEQPLSLPLTVHDLKPMGFDLQLVY